MPVRIAFTLKLEEALQIHSLLESQGLHPAPVDTSAHVSVAGDEQGYQVEIPKGEAKAASALLRRAGLAKCLVE